MNRKSSHSADESQSTIWEQIRSAAKDSEQRNRLIQRYRPALLASLMHDPKLNLQFHDAEDVLQDFLSLQLDRILVSASPQLGLFRSFLWASLRNFCVSRRRSRQTEKRAPDHASQFPEEGEKNLAQNNDTDLFETMWAIQILGEAMAGMRQDCMQKNRPDLWGIFESRDLSVLFGSPPVPFEVLMRQWDFGSQKQAMNALATARKKLARFLKELLNEQGASDVEHDLNQFLNAVAVAGPELMDRLRSILWGRALDVSISSMICTEFNPASLQFVRDPFLPSDAGAVFRELLIEKPLTDYLESPPQLMSVLRQSLNDRGLPNANLFEILSLEDPGLELLTAIKEIAKYQRYDLDRRTPEAVSTAVYYLCIARGIRENRNQLTSADNKTLGKGFTWIIDQPWVDVWVAQIARDGLAELRKTDS